MVEGLLYLIGQMEPIWVISTIIIGLILGYTSKDIEFEWKAVYLLIFFYVPFAVARTIAFILGGTAAVSGTGVIGVLFFTLYTIVFVIGRKIGRKLDQK